VHNVREGSNVKLATMYTGDGRTIAAVLGDQVIVLRRSIR
jgi:hypothetical protein